MSLSEARDNIGQKVVYHGWGGVEEGVITSVNDRYVFVRYGGDVISKATSPEGLTLLMRSWT